MEEGDPTYDEMMCFYLPPLPVPRHASLPPSIPPQDPLASQPPSASPFTTPSPFGSLDYAVIVNDNAWAILRSLLVQLPRLQTLLRIQLRSAVTPGQVRRSLRC